MRPVRHSLIGPLAVLGALLFSPGAARAQSCSGEDDVSLNQILAEVRAKAIAELTGKQPLETPDSKQITAASDTGDATSLVSGADIPTLFALAAERGLASTSDGKITLNLSPFDVLAALDPQVRDRQSLYEKHALARRFGLSATLGGKGDSFDRDGDGVADPALEAVDLQDIVAWEARVRLSKSSRDRRDADNYKTFFTSISSAFEAQDDRFDQIVVSITKALGTTNPELRSTTNPSCLSRSELQKFLDRPALREQILALAQADVALAAKAEAAAKEVDKKPIWTLVAGVLSRKDDFGPDKRMAAIRGAMGGQDRNFNLNLEWNETDNPGGTKPTMWKAGLEYSVLVLKGSALSADGIKVAGSGAYEIYDNVPSAKFDTVARLNAKLELPVAKGVKIPISVTWANHHDLIEGESDIRGHIGFTIDLSEARKHFLPN
ncbi:MAG TPA: hypothetical protein VN783_06225 [Thermoanaerobaculia bacterium]|nr:hypothetical protein [Thermoanaerobaculia bacterium]